MTDFVDPQQPFGMRRRHRRAIPDEYNGDNVEGNEGVHQNNSYNSNTSDRLIPQDRERGHEATAVAAFAASNRRHEMLDQQQQRHQQRYQETIRPPSDDIDEYDDDDDDDDGFFARRSITARRGRISSMHTRRTTAHRTVCGLSHVYCLISFALALLAVVLAPVTFSSNNSSSLWLEHTMTTTSAATAAAATDISTTTTSSGISGATPGTSSISTPSPNDPGSMEEFSRDWWQSLQQWLATQQQQQQQQQQHNNNRNNNNKNSNLHPPTKQGDDGDNDHDSLWVAMWKFWWKQPTALTTNSNTNRHSIKSQKAEKGTIATTTTSTPRNDGYNDNKGSQTARQFLDHLFTLIDRSLDKMVKPEPFVSFWTRWIDPEIRQPSATTTIPNIIDKILTSTPRLLTIANFLLAMTYLLHSAVAAWFLGGPSYGAGTLGTNATNNAAAANNNNTILGNSNNNLNMGEFSTAPARERMGGFLVFKLLLISAVVAPDTLDLLILLTWYTLLSCLKSLDHLAHATTMHLSALGQPPKTGVVQLLSCVLFCNILAAAMCVALFHAAGWGMVLLLTCDCVLLAADVLSHILKHCQCVLEDLHSQTIQSLEARQLALHNNNNTVNQQISDQGQDQQRSENGHALIGSEDRSPSQEISHNRDNHDHDDENHEVEPQAATIITNMSPEQIFQESRHLDRQMEVLDLAHARRLSILDSAMFALELLCHLLTVAHFCHIWSLHGVQFTLIDGVLALHLHSAVSSACKKIAQRRNIHSIVRDLQGLFPNASDQELRKATLAGDVCCICLGTMSTGGHVKKVRCGHLYHTHCLREVVERAQSIQAAKCPLCRASVLDGRRATNTTGTANNVGGAPAQPQQQPPVGAGEGVPPAPAGLLPGERSLFHFSTEGIVPAWVPIPAFSFEVVRRPPTPPQALPQTQQVVAPDRTTTNNNTRNNDLGINAQRLDNNNLPQQHLQPEPTPHQPSLLRRMLVLAGAIPMSPEEEARALAQLVDMFPQYDRSDLLRELRDRGSSEAVAESILMGVFTGVARGD